MKRTISGTHTSGTYTSGTQSSGMLTLKYQAKVTDRMNYRLPIFAIIAAALLAAGCRSNNVKGTYAGRNDPYDRTQIAFSGTYGPQLERQTAVQQPIATRDSSNLLRVTVPVRSAVDDTLYVEYQVTFLDSAGQQIQQLAWQPKTLEANVPNEVSFVSASPRAADFRCAFRFAR